MFENNEFPDTYSEVPGVFDDITEDAAAVVDVEGKEADVRAELDEGNKSNENKWLVYKVLFLVWACNRNIQSMLQIVYFN